MRFAQAVRGLLHTSAALQHGADTNAFEHHQTGRGWTAADCCHSETSAVVN